MPSLISGRQIASALAVRPDDLLVTVNGARRRSAGARSRTVFAEGARAGADTALAGWYHPYAG